MMVKLQNYKITNEQKSYWSFCVTAWQVILDHNLIINATIYLSLFMIIIFYIFALSFHYIHTGG